MTEELYFQWQNEVLRTTIYPRREAMLSNFLVYYKEIELWAEYKNKDISGETSEYYAQKRQVVEAAVKAYYDYRNYFMKEDVRTDYAAKFGQLDEDALGKIFAFHKTFATYMPRFTNPRSETYFVSQQVLNWQQVCKDYKTKVTSKQRRVYIMKNQTPPHPNAAKEEAELAIMEKTALAMLDEEYRRLNEFVKASSKIEKRKLEIAKAVDDAQKKKIVVAQKLSALQPEVDRQAALQNRASGELARLKSPPDAAAAKAYLFTPDVPTQIRAKFPAASQDLINQIASFRKSLVTQLNAAKTIPAGLIVVRNTLYNVGQYQKSIERDILKHETDLKNMGPTWKYKAEREGLRNNLRDVSLKAVAEEMARLTDFQTVMEAAGRTPEQTNSLIQAKEKELAALNARLSQLRTDAQAFQSAINSYNAILLLDEKTRLAQYVPDPTTPVNVKDIVRLKVDEYRACLVSMDHYQLLELAVERFRSQPDRYPKWLQYMVIHFSGMRYASAHGSWADPKDLLANLRILSIDREVKGLDDDTVETFCQQKLEDYQPAAGASTGTVGGRPMLSHASDPEWQDRISQHLKRLKRAIEINSPAYQRNALIDLRTDESNFEIDGLQPAQVYDELMSYKDDLPDWMWKEIVKLTDLRVNEVNDKNWEKPTTPPPAYSQRDAELRQVLNDWKNKYVTGWREEHDRSDQLIVTRAVCNEVAEHIQHLRGNTPDGGLRAKPKWYQRNESANPQAYFVKPQTAADFKTGASILWLRFVGKEPNAWQVADAVITKRGGFGVLPASFPPKGPNVPAGTTAWSYNRSGPITRTRMVAGEKGAQVRQAQWLRWMHEATVVEVAETAEGTVVLTFETALPSDDPRLSSIGVFKHYLEGDLLSDRDEDNYYPAFVGYVPEGKVPAENLEEMLDWNKILLKPPSLQIV